MASTSETNEWKTRRSSGILKRAAPEEIEVTEQTEYTKFGDPCQRRFSKRVSFADTNQIKEIVRMQDIAQNWHDSTSSSEGGMSRLTDISNLTTPTIRKPMQQQQAQQCEKDPKALQNLLQGSILDHTVNKSMNETQGSCAMDMSGAAPTTGFFFDNSRLGFGGDGEDDSNALVEETHHEDKENADLAQSFYTKDFLRSLQLLDNNEKEKNVQKSVVTEQRHPLVNPPSYKQCAKGAGRKSIVPTLQSEEDTNGGNEDMEFTTAIQSGPQNYGDAVEPSKDTSFANTCDGDMEFTCALQPQNPLTCSENISNLDKQNDKALDHPSSSDRNGDDMDFTCAVQQTPSEKLLQPVTSVTRANEEEAPSFNIGEMELTECIAKGTGEDDSNALVEETHDNDKENTDLTQSFYTKNFLRSLQLVDNTKKEKNVQKSNATEQRHPLVNPPSYKQCAKGAGRKSIVPILQTEDGTNGGNEDMEFTTAFQSGPQNSTDAVESPKDTSFANICDGDMEFTCALQPQNSLTRSENISNLDKKNDKPLDHPLSSDRNGDDMDFTCAIQQTPSENLQPPESSVTKANDEEAPSFNIGEMELTECIAQGADKTKNIENNGSDVDKKIDNIDDGMDFTCAISNRKPPQNLPDSIATIQKDKIDVSSEQWNFTEAIKTPHVLAETSLQDHLQQGERTIVLDHSLTGDMDLTCASIGPETVQHIGATEGLDNAASKCQGKENPRVAEADKLTGNKQPSANDDNAMDITCFTPPVVMNQVVTPDCSNSQDVVSQSDTASAVTSTTIFLTENDNGGNVEPEHFVQQNEKSDIVQTHTPAVTSIPKVIQRSEPQQFAFTTQPETNMESGSSSSEANHSVSIVNETAVESLFDSEDVTFASPLKKRIRKIRNSIGLYKAKKTKLDKRCLKSSDTRESINKFLLPEESSVEENGAVNAKYPRTTFEAIPETQEADQGPTASIETRVVETASTASEEDEVFVPNTQDSSLHVVNVDETFEIPETQDTKQESTESNIFDEFKFGFSGDASEHLQSASAGNGSLNTDNAGVEQNFISNVSTEPTAELLAPVNNEKSLIEEQTRALGLSMILDKSLMEDIRRKECDRNEENITIQEFLEDYARINMRNLKKSRRSIIVPLANPEAPTTLKDMFKAKYWTPREVFVRDSCVELMQNKIAWLEENVSKLEEQIHASNPEDFKTIRNDPDETSEALLNLRKLASNCRTLGKVYWKRDATKLYKGLNKEMNLFLNEDLIPMIEQLKNPKELLDKTLKKIEEDGEKLDEALQTYESQKSPATAEQATLYQELQAQLESLKARHEELKKNKASTEDSKRELRERRDVLLNKIINEDVTNSKAEKERQKLEESLSSMQKSCEWKLCEVNKDMLRFSFLGGSIIFKATFEESSDYREWTRKIKEYSIETDLTQVVLQTDIELYKLLHKLWKDPLISPKLVTEYSNLTGLKNVLEVLSSFSRASKELINDRDWIDCRFVCEACITSQDALITVPFLPPQPGVDGFKVKFAFGNETVESSEVPVDRILQNGFVPSSHEYIPGKRRLDHLGKNDVKRVIDAIEPGQHYMRRAVDALLKMIEYKF